MDVSTVNTSIASPSTQKVTDVTSRVEGGNPSSSEKVAQQSEVQISKAQLDSQVEQLNRKLEEMGQSIVFGVDDSTSETIVKVFDKSSEELIRQFPTEVSLKVMKNIQDYLERAQQTGSESKESLTGNLINEII